MPKGIYLYDSGAREHFSCAPGPSGWRYVSQTDTVRTDVTVDASWRQIRVIAGAVKGGVVGPDALWTRGSEPERVVRAAGFTGASPAFVVTTVRLLRLGLLDRRRVHLVDVDTGLEVDQGWALVDVSEHETETVPLPVERYEVADLATAERRVVHVAGDVVLEAPGLELVELDSPPTLGS